MKKVQQNKDPLLLKISLILLIAESFLLLGLASSQQNGLSWSNFPTFALYLGPLAASVIFSWLYLVANSKIYKILALIFLFAHLLSWFFIGILAHLNQ